MGDKHGPLRLASYLQIHNSVIAQFEARGCVLSNGLEIAAYGGGNVLIAGEIECVGGFCIDVHKILEVIDGEGANARVQTVSYRYQAWLRGRGNLLRYDSPHPHRPHHHVHRYDLRHNDREGRILEIEGREWPTLGEVIEEVEAWYFENHEWVDSAH